MKNIYYTVGYDFNENFEGDLIVNEHYGKSIYTYTIDGNEMKTIFNKNIKIEDNTEKFIINELQKYLTQIGVNNIKDISLIIL